jgi:NAD(P)-dependent dehydrogenase (short-subunit alcohol dehydrogenase family)
MRGLKGKVAIVTGATGSVGIAIARRLSQEGAAVVGLGRSLDAGEVAAAELRAAGGSAEFIGCDVAVEADVTHSVARTVAAHGRLDILVNNAAAIDRIRAGEERSVADEAPETFEWILRVGVHGPFLLAKHSLPHLVGGGGGSIVNVSSVAGMKAHPGMTAYGPSKAALEALSRQIAVDYGPARVRSNVVMIGTVRNSQNGYLYDHPEVAPALMGNQMLQREGSPHDVAAAVAFLTSDDAAHITAAVLPVDGGSSVKASVPNISNVYAARRGEAR